MCSYDMPSETPNRICKGICKKFRAKKVSFKGRYDAGQAHCQICDIWIDYKGCHVRDGSPAKEKTMGWFCNCCNYRVRQNPRNKKYKERLRRVQGQHVGSEQESGQSSDQTSKDPSDVDSMVLKALEIIKDSSKGIYYAELKKSIEISDNDMNELVLKIIQKGVLRKEIRYEQRTLDILFEFKDQ